ncbi:A/G-specific adenine glycosylase [Polynucleobacter sp.]|uniref:A/G-specific adenine glycosylase n=1 Tax=Polynucleobacter sp. TaxID=2029855 RepID=UPI0027341A00|nr:A/G-specific adenine glycosylase [Polynucleobacter sp.]MDP3121718.1 A/G-specific adenine glycosylase [Polynucleobacter sp.]
MPKALSTQPTHDAALIASFSKQLIQWHKKHGRHGLPWQSITDPYAVWVSEIMLQQTQVATVLERYPKMMKRFPSVVHLARANIDEILAEWSGLGYYSRARNLHACAKQVVTQYQGKFPSDPMALEGLSGIGRSTAGAIAAFAFQARAPILDANVKRVLARLFGISGALQEKKVTDSLWQLATELLPRSPQHMPVYTQALMDFGATWCTAKQPVCLTQKAPCPFEGSCQAKALDQVLAIPKKEIKKKSPQFACAVGVLTHGNTVLLQKRPAKAIWGGLWSLPESPWQAQTAIDLSSTVQAESLTGEQLIGLILPNLSSKKTPALFGGLVRTGMGIKHIFSHRVLQIQTYEMALNAKAKKELDRSIGSTENQFIWAELDTLEQYGLPQPIRLLLEGRNPARGGAESDQYTNAAPIALKSSS